MIAAYGGKCVCCDESQPEFLSLDHIANDGASERKERGWKLSGVHLYRALRRAGYPKERYQLLCMNCNWAKRNSGRCPHFCKEWT